MRILKSYDEFAEEWELFGFIMEEGNKYYMQNLSGEEGLVYDFNVTVGDTIAINNPFGFMLLNVIVTNIDSVLIEPAYEYRKRITLFEFENFGFEEYWIEGIGSLAGITQSGWDMTMITGANDFTLLCYYQEEEIWYKSDLYSLCFYPIVSVPYAIQQGDYITLIPNPVKNDSYLIIDTPNKQDLVVKLFNSASKLIQVFQITAPAKIKINSTHFQKGVYFYQVTSNKKVIHNDKFLVL